MPSYSLLVRYSHRTSRTLCHHKSMARGLCSLHSFLNLPRFDLKFGGPFIFVLDHPVQLATNQDCKPSHVQPEHQDNDRSKRTVGCTVAVEKVQIHAKTK